MYVNVWSIVVMLILLSSGTLKADPITPTELHATLGIVTNFILSNEKLTYNGTEYGMIISPHTGRIWLDRNVGALRSCNMLKDTACFGGYYQWGRGTDGHEDPTSATRDSRIITGTKFVIGFSDWTESDSQGINRKAIWDRTDGSSVCPVDFRIPSSPEFIAEDSLNFLNLPASGRRLETGLYQPDIGDNSEYGYLWTNSPRADGTNAHYVVHKLDFFNTITHGLRSKGYNIRCIKD